MTLAEAVDLFPSRSDADIILCALLGHDRPWVFAHGEEPLAADQERAVRTAAQRRNAGEPVAYITGEKAFGSHVYTVTRDVLIPRPCTEDLVTLAAEWCEEPFDVVRCIDTDIVAAGFSFARKGPTQLLADIGTGSGCIAVELALRCPGLRVMATDVAPRALDCARSNALRFGADITFACGPLLAPLLAVDVPFTVVSNPPYVPVSAPVGDDVRAFEPPGAVFAGERGTDVLLPLVAEARRHPLCRGILVECREDQVQALARAAGEG